MCRKMPFSIFETRTATGSELFSLLTCPHTTTFPLLSIFTPLEMSSTKIWETIQSKHAKCFLPVTVRVSKTHALKLSKHIFFDIDIVVKNKSKCELSWSILLSTTSPRHYSFPRLSFSHCFYMLTNFPKVFAHLHKMQRVHFHVGIVVFNCQQILTKIYFVIFDIVVKKQQQMECGLAWSVLLSTTVQVIPWSNSVMKLFPLQTHRQSARRPL